MTETDKPEQISTIDEPVSAFHEPTESEKELTKFVLDHTDKWREHRDQNYLDDWNEYERIFRGKYSSTDKTRESERSKIISPATQQAVETRHAEVMEAIFGQGEFFDIADDVLDENGSFDVEKLKKQLQEDFGRDKIRKSIDQIGLLGEIYGTGIGEIVVGMEKVYTPTRIPLDSIQMAYGVTEGERFYVRINPVNPKNFLFDPNGTSIDDCMGVAIEKYVSAHKIAQGIKSGKYHNIDVSSLYESDELEPTQEKSQYQNDKILMLTYYGLVPREYLTEDEEIETFEELSEGLDDYEDMVEAIVTLANGKLLKAIESPYMMKDRPIILYQADTVPNRLLGRGTVEKAYNMQKAIDGSMRSHLDALALTVAPMVGLDSTRLPRGAKFEVKPGKAWLFNGNPSEIVYPFKFGSTDGQAMNTSKEFERMLLMATATIDSNGVPSQVSRDGDLNMAVATMIKKYKRILVNFQEDFLIPFIYKAAWRYMQFDPNRYPSVDVKFLPKATLGIIAREFEQKQLAFLIQTLGAQSALTPILMQGIVKNSSISDKEKMLAQLQQAMQKDPEADQFKKMAAMTELRKGSAEATLKEAQAKKASVEADLAPKEVNAKIISALSNNLDDDAEGKDFERRVKLAELMLKEEDINSNERIARMQSSDKKAEMSQNTAYLSSAEQAMQ